MGVGTDSAIARPAFPCRAYGRTVLSEKIIRGSYAEFLCSSWTPDQCCGSHEVVETYRLPDYPSGFRENLLEKEYASATLREYEMGWEVDGDARAL